MQSKNREWQQNLLVLLLVNLLIAAIAPGFFQLFPDIWGDYIVAFVAGAVILTFFDRRYGRALWSSLIFVVYLIWQIILSNLSLAWLVVQPKPKLDPGIVAIPLDLETGLEITVLASAITLTPGTISIDLARDDQARPVLYVHSLVVEDPDKLRASIKQGFEQMILRVSQG